VGKSEKLDGGHVVLGKRKRSSHLRPKRLYGDSYKDAERGYKKINCTEDGKK